MKLVNLLLILIATLVALVVAEITLRYMGYEPWQGNQVSEREPLVEIDDRLGWRLRPGKFMHSAYSEDVEDLIFTVSSAGNRLSYIDQDFLASNRKQLLLLGGSFTHGFAVTDNETYPWYLQQELPDHEVVNFAVPAYSTYQSLLMFRHLTRQGIAPNVVLYGFIDHHEIRNIASDYWVNMLARNSNSMDFIVPYVYEVEGKMQEGGVRQMQRLPFNEQSALINLVEKYRVLLSAQETEQNKTTLTRELIKRLRDEVKAYDESTEFYVVYLWSNNNLKKDYMSFFEEAGIKVMDCDFPMSARYQVKNETHPNHILNKKYADCIAEQLN